MAADVMLESSNLVFAFCILFCRMTQKMICGMILDSELLVTGHDYLMTFFPAKMTDMVFDSICLNVGNSNLDVIILQG